MSGSVGTTRPALDALYQQSLTHSRGGRRVLRGRILLDALLADDDSPTSDADVRRLHDRDDVVRLLGTLGAEATREVLGLVPDGNYPPDELAESGRLDQALLREGVTARYIYEPGWVRHAAGRAYIAALTAGGAQVRIIDRVPHRLMIYDRSAAVLPVGSPEDDRGALVLREQAMVYSLQALFSVIWRRSTDVRVFDAEVERHCGPRDRQILVLMGSGVTDDVAARGMGVSTRTYRRYVSELMLRLDAQSRFQAGVRAVERGWL